jgi:hypothetical protein
MATNLRWRSLVAGIVTVAGLAQASQGYDADLNGDGVVDGTDQAILLASWGPCSGCPGDLNGDGVVDSADLAIWMTAPPDSGDGDDSVDDGGLYSPGDGEKSPLSTEDGADGADSGGDSGGDPFDDGAGVHVVPLPAPAWITLGGLFGAFYLRRRMLGR